MFSKNDNQISNLPFFVKVKPCFDKLYCGFKNKFPYKTFQIYFEYLEMVTKRHSQK